MTAGLARALAPAGGMAAVWWTDRLVPFPPCSPTAWTSIEPLMAVFDLARVALLAAAVYWLLLLAAAGLARLFRWRRVAAAISRSPGGRRALKLVVGTAVVGSSLSAAAIPAGASPPPGPAPILYAASPAATHAELRGTHRLASRPIRALPARAGRTWTVRPGDDLWSIAESTLRAALGRDPGEREIARYWLTVIDRNRARLPIPSDSSLLYPGDIVVLPPPDTLLP